MTLAAEDANSKLVDVVTFAYADIEAWVDVRLVTADKILIGYDQYSAALCSTWRKFCTVLHTKAFYTSVIGGPFNGQRKEMSVSLPSCSRTVWRALNPRVRCAFDNVCFQFPQIHMQPSWHHLLPIPTKNHHLYSVLIWVLSKNEDFIIGRIWNIEEPIRELWKTR